MFDLTVVIPTFNRRDLLRDLVQSLRNQTYPTERYEILIVSDGSTDGTEELYEPPLRSPVTRVVGQEKRGFGLSRARNLGTALAQGRLILFVDDDMLADPRLVEAHVQAHDELGTGVAVCGQVKLAADLPDTPFCKIVIGGICQLFKETPDPGFLPFGLALSWQTSFKRADLERLGGYSESFRSYGWEDIEFSYRADQEGLRFFYEPRAVSFHRDQRNTLRLHMQRARNSSRMAPLLFAHHPALKALLPMYADKGPLHWRSEGVCLTSKKAMRRLLATPPVMMIAEAMTPLVEGCFTHRATLLRRWYAFVVGNHILQGYREGLAELSSTQVGSAEPGAQTAGPSPTEFAKS